MVEKECQTRLQGHLDEDAGGVGGVDGDLVVALGGGPARGLDHRQLDGAGAAGTVGGAQLGGQGAQLGGAAGANLWRHLVGAVGSRRACAGYA